MLPVAKTLAPTISRFFDDDWNNLFDWTDRRFSGMMSTLPSVNIYESNDAFMLDMAAPGFKKEDFIVEFDQDHLIIRVENENSEKTSDDLRITRREFNYSGFSRTFKLGNQIIDESKIKAKYENGLLKLLLPKREEAKIKPPRLIKIS